MNLVKNGKYKAKVLEHAITTTKKGFPQAAVKFGFETEDGPRELIWFGSFKEGAVEYTLKALVNCGLKGNNPADPLEIGKEVSITVEIDQDLDGNDRNVIRWVNKLGGLGTKIDEKNARAALEKFCGAVMSIKQNEGLGSEPKKTNGKKLKNQAPVVDDDDELPF